MKAYSIIRNDDLHNLGDVVNEYIRDGWAPLGGVQVEEIRGDHYTDRKGNDHTAMAVQYLQTMIRPQFVVRP